LMSSLLHWRTGCSGVMHRLWNFPVGPLRSANIAQKSSFSFNRTLAQRINPMPHESIQFTAIPPPQRLMQPARIPKRLLLGPGPTNLPESVRAALGASMLGHMHPEFFDIMDDTKAGIQYAFQTENSLTFAVSGTGHAGMECALVNLLEPGESLLVVHNGIWGQRAADLGNRLNLNVTTIRVPEGGAATLEEFQKAVETHKPAVAFVCHGESSTGVLHPLEGFGEVCRKNGALLLVDTVASLGAAPFHADGLLVDCVYAASQKVMNSPPGLAPISFGERALAKLRFRKSRVASFYFDALELGNYWGCFVEPRRYHHTAPISLVYALRESLALLAKEGLDHSVQRHATNVQLLYSTVHALGLELFVEQPNLRLPCLTTVKVPPGVDWLAVQKRVMSLGIEIAGGLGPTVGKLWRIGTFGANSNPEVIKELGKVLSEALEVPQEAEEQVQQEGLKAAL